MLSKNILLMWHLCGLKKSPVRSLIVVLLSFFEVYKKMFKAKKVQTLITKLTILPLVKSQLVENVTILYFARVKLEKEKYGTLFLVVKGCFLIIVSSQWGQVLEKGYHFLSAMMVGLINFWIKPSFDKYIVKTWFFRVIWYFWYKMSIKMVKKKIIRSFSSLGKFSMQVYTFPHW